MAPTFFAKLRARCEKRELEKARQEGSEARRKHNEVVACAEWAAAALAVAEKLATRFSSRNAARSPLPRTLS